MGKGKKNKKVERNNKKHRVGKLGRKREGHRLKKKRADVLEERMIIQF